MPPGRPSDYTPELATLICEMVAEGLPLREITSTEGIPDKATIFRWMLKHDDFRDNYARAKDTQAEHMAEELLEIADDGTNDWMERNAGNGQTITVPDQEHINRSRLRVDTRKWLMSKMAPKKYGDKTAVEHSGNLTLEGLVLDSMKPKE